MRIIATLLCTLVVFSFLAAPGMSEETDTTATAVIEFYQTQAVGEKIIKRELRVGFKSKNGELISEAHNVTFDTEQEEPSSRERILAEHYLGNPIEKERLADLLWTILMSPEFLLVR